jgi:hypothetical protein
MDLSTSVRDWWWSRVPRGALDAVVQWSLSESAPASLIATVFFQVAIFTALITR